MYDTPHGQPGWLMREAPSGDARVLGFIAQHGQLTLAQMLRQRPVDGFHELLVTMQDGDTSKPGAVYLHRDDPGRLIHVSPRRSPGPTTVSKPPPPQGARRGLHCYLICLQRSQVRRRYVKDKLLPALPQFECEIVDAVDGRAMLEASTSATSPHGEDSTDAASGAKGAEGAWADFVAPNRDHHHICQQQGETGFVFTFDRHCTPGEVGCALSHLKVLSAIVREGRPWSVVLEDDAAPVAGFADCVEAAIAAVPSDADAPLIYLGYPDAMLKLRDGRRPGESEDEDTRSGSVDAGAGSRLLRASHVWTTYGYLVSLAAAKQLMGGIVPVDKPVDHHYVLACACAAVNAFACERQLVELAPHYSESTIGGW